MTTNQGRVASGGRPRAFENDDIFRATTRVLLSAGYGGLTLEAVAREAGCSAPAISKRFGSKGGLLQAYLAWSHQTIIDRFRAFRQIHTSPLAALRSRYLIPVEERPEEFGAFTGWREMRRDPELAPIAEGRRLLWAAEIASSLADAWDAGELVDCDIDELAHALHAALTGVTVLWTPEDGSLIDRIAATFDVVIDPYRARPSTSVAPAQDSVPIRASS